MSPETQCCQSRRNICKDVRIQVVHNQGPQNTLKKNTSLKILHDSAGCARMNLFKQIGETSEANAKCWVGRKTVIKCYRKEKKKKEEENYTKLIKRRGEKCTSFIEELK